MQDDIAALQDALFEIFSAGFEAGQAQSTDLKTAFGEWLQQAMLQYLPPTSPFVS